MYKIKFKYWSGDSYHSENLEEILDYEWEDLNIVKECLKRIYEHYKWYENINNRNLYNKEILEKPKWFNVKCSSYTDEYYLINIPLTNEKEIQFKPPWIGYFEGLYSAEIVIDNDDDDMKFTIN